MTPDPMPPQPDVLDDALALAGIGWRVLPIKPGTKRPSLSEWPHAASSDPTVITSWFTGLYRGHGLGVLTGLRPDGWTMFVLDVDVAKGKLGAESLAEHERQHKPLPPTVEATTGSGGRHLFFLSPPGIAVHGTQTGKNAGKLGNGLDIRSNGGQVIVAPSVHMDTGTPYTWLRSPHEHPVEKAPGWLLALVAVPTERDKPIALPEPPAPARTDADDSIAAWVNDTHDWQTVLTGDGWTPSAPRGDEQAWTRPGKDASDGTSAVLHLPDGPFVVWSTSVPALQQPWATTRTGDGWTFSMFGYIAATRHAGDRSATASAARTAKNAGASWKPPPANTLDEPDDLADWEAIDLAPIAAEILAGTRTREQPTILEVTT